MDYDQPTESKIRYRKVVKQLQRAAHANHRAAAAADLRNYRESPIIAPLLHAATTDPDARVRWQAIQTLRQRYFRLDKFAKYLVPLLEDDSPRVQVAIVDGLFEMIDSESMQVLLFHILESDDISAAIHALDLLEGLVQVRGVDAQMLLPTLLDLLQGDEIALSCAAARILGHLKIAQAAPLIAERLLVNGGDNTRLIAIQALGEIGTGEAVKALLPMLQNPRYLDDAARAIAMTGDTRAVPHLIHALQRDPRLSLVDALGRLKDPRAVSPLVNLFHQAGGQPYEYDSILAALRLIGTREALSAVAMWEQ